MSAVLSISTRRPYGVTRVCRMWGVPRAGIYRGRRVIAPSTPRRRPGPQGPMPNAALVEAIRSVLLASPFHGEGYRKVWARLRFQGIRTAARRVRRLMKEHGLLAPHRPAPRLAHPHDGTIVTGRVDEVWGTDMTQTVTTAEGRAYVFIAVDHCSGEFVGIHASSSASRWEALEPIRQGMARHFGGVEADTALGLILRHDHGSNTMAEDFQREIRFLGITSSPSFGRQPEGNGVAERAIRTLKEQLLWVQHFATIEDLRQGLAAFATLYNATWLRARHGHRTPDQIRAEQLGLAPEAATGLKSAA